MAWTVYVAVLFFERRQQFRVAWLSLIWASAGLDLAGLRLGLEEAPSFFRTLLLSILWSVYAWRSQRVRNTFVS